MARITTVQFRNDMAKTVNRVAFGKERIVLERHGDGVIALVPIEDMELLEELEDRIDIEEAKKVLKSRASKVPLEKVKKAFGL